MEEHLSEVVPRDFLCCPLCGEEYLEPVYLPCLHSFCRACIDDHIEATATSTAAATTTTPPSSASSPQPPTSGRSKTKPKDPGPESASSVVERIELLLSDENPPTKGGDLEVRTSVSDSPEPVQTTTTFMCPVCGTKTVLDKTEEEDVKTGGSGGGRFNDNSFLGKLGKLKSPRPSLPDNVFARRL
ncbi:hypothetical protein EGW08_021740, partial [Elysia chlorotica]